MKSSLLAPIATGKFAWYSPATHSSFPESEKERGSGMATLSQTVPAQRSKPFAGPCGLVDKYFYFAMALLFPVIVAWGFSRTANDSLFHAVIPRPRILWFHAAVFSGWIIFFLFQSILIRTRNVKRHRFFGWFGAALGTAMVPLGIATAIAMSRFDATQLHQVGVEPFLIIPLFDIATFGVLLALAIAWRKKPQLHRPLLFMATCMLLDAPFDRFDFIFNHDLGFLCLDLIISLGMARDFVVNRRIHRVYLIAFPALVVSQALALFIWHSEAAWWVRMAHAILA